jgi:hypothetical protein
MKLMLIFIIMLFFCCQSNKSFIEYEKTNKTNTIHLHIFGLEVLKNK